MHTKRRSNKREGHHIIKVPTYVRIRVGIWQKTSAPRVSDHVATSRVKTRGHDATLPAARFETRPGRPLTSTGIQVYTDRNHLITLYEYRITISYYAPPPRRVGEITM